MLLVAFPRLQRQPHRRPPLRIVRDADEPPRQMPLQLVPRGHKTGMRATITERHPKALRRPDRDIRAEFARRFEQRQR
jgi:hypothetical protein